MNTPDQFARLEVVRIARNILDGKIRPLLGARLLCSYAHQFEQEFGPEAWRLIVGVDSESDALPIGPERTHWAPEALREKDRKADRYEQQVRDALLQVAQELLTKFSKL